MKFVKLSIFALAAALAVVSCRSQYEAMLNSSDTDAKYDAAMAYFQKEKYAKSASLFESLSILTNGTERDDTVQYYWGLSNYLLKDYYTAETNFNQFTINFPRSPFTEDARFLRIDCLYRQTRRYELDQTPTNLAINTINEYLKEYPANPHVSDCTSMLTDLSGRLDRKSYEAARLYFKMEDYKASRVAFRNILKDDPDNIYREDILYYIAKSSYKYANLSVRSKQKERFLTFMDDYLNFVGEIPQSPYRKELDLLYSRAQKSIGSYSAADEISKRQEKEFDKERKAAQKDGKKSK